METLTGHRIPVKSSDVAWQLVDEKAVILHIPGKMLRGFNLVASRIWQLIDGKRTLTEIARDVSAEYSCAEEEVLEDVKTFLDELIEKKMIAFSNVTTHQ